MKKSRVDLREIAVTKEGVVITKDGSLSVETGQHTGRSPNAKYIVIDNVTADTVDWRNNQGMNQKVWKEFKEDFLNSKTFSSKNNLFTQKVSAGHKSFREIKINVHTELAWHSLFALNMFEEIGENEECEFDLYYVPSFTNEPSVVISFEEKMIIISGTKYAGEMKKSVFTVLNHVLPDENVLPMHCSINLDKNNENPCIFFGLSGTGKTTLSADSSRNLVGDDEHGWSHSGLFNFESGCYAKVIYLDKEKEPDIWEASQGEESILENVVLKSGKPDFFDKSLTENTRCSYPLKYIKNSVSSRSTKNQPKNVIMLTCDAFGILPAIAKLTPEEAWKFFVIGYTSKIAGTEKGIVDPVATFSPCFGLPFMTRNPKEYADILKNFVEKNEVNCWMLNTGWVGGPYGVGERISIVDTRSILSKIYNGELLNCDYFEHPYTNMLVPKVGGLDLRLLKPEISWENLKDYQNACFKLVDNMRKIIISL